MNPCGLVLWVTVGAGMGCEFATLTQPIPMTCVWRVSTRVDGPSGICQCDWVTHSHTIPLVWFSPTTTFTAHHPSRSQLQPTTHTHPSLLWGMWAGLFLLDWGVWQEEHKGGPSKWEAQLVCHENRPWLMAHSHLSLVFASPVYRTGNIHRTELDWTTVWSFSSCSCPHLGSVQLPVAIFL